MTIAKWLFVVSNQYGIKINHDFVLTGDSIIRHKQQLQRRLDSTNGTQPSSFFATAEDCKAFMNIDSKLTESTQKVYYCFHLV